MKSFSTPENSTSKWGCKEFCCTLDLPSDESAAKELRLMMLACEDQPPYGPQDNCAQMFMNLISAALLDTYITKPAITIQPFKISISIYNVKEEHYPKTTSEWDSYQGIIITGSFSSAYDNDDWIRKLKEIIVTEIHPKQRKTFGLCFGHQIFAHAFQHENGLCIKCPHGQQLGMRVSPCSVEGKRLLQRRPSALPMFVCDVNTLMHVEKGRPTDDDNLHLLYTHQDMVSTLPPFAVPLASTEKVDIVSAAYFANQLESEAFRDENPDEYCSVPYNGTRPYALTFQAHPEYVGQNGINDTFRNIVSRANIPQDERQKVICDAEEQFNLLHDDTISLMLSVGAILGWF